MPSQAVLKSSAKKRDDCLSSISSWRIQLDSVEYTGVDEFCYWRKIHQENSALVGETNVYETNWMRFVYFLFMLHVIVLFFLWNAWRYFYFLFPYSPRLVGFVICHKTTNKSTKLFSKLITNSKFTNGQSRTAIAIMPPLFVFAVTSEQKLTHRMHEVASENEHTIEVRA